MVHLEPPLFDRLRQAAYDRDQPMAALVREVLRRDLFPREIVEKLAYQEEYRPAGGGLLSRLRAKRAEETTE